MFIVLFYLFNKILCIYYVLITLKKKLIFYIGLKYNTFNNVYLIINKMFFIYDFKKILLIYVIFKYVYIRYL